MSRNLASSINGIGEQANVKGTVTVVYVPKLGYNLFAPNAEFDGEFWDSIGGPEGVMTRS